jgi:integrase
MAPQDLWFKFERGPDGKMPRDADGKPIRRKVPSANHGRGQRWRITYVDPETGKERNEHFDRKQDAIDRENTVGADLLRGQYVDPRKGKVKLEDYAERWRRNQLHDASTAAGVERIFRLHVYPHIGQQPLAAVKKTMLQGVIKKWTEALAPSTIETYWMYVKAMFTDAADDDDIGKSPCVGVSLPSEEAKRRYIPQPAEVHAIAQSGPMAPYRPVAYIAAGCGLRPSEIFGLEVDCVDFLRREIHVRQQLKFVKGTGVHLAPPKTATSDRIVELPDGVAAELSRHMQLFPPRTLELPDLTNSRKPTRRPVQLLFTTPVRAGDDAVNANTLIVRRHRLHKAGDHSICLPRNCPQSGEAPETPVRQSYLGGGPVYGSLWSKPWQDAVALAGLPIGFGLHGLRHYFATLLIHGGKSVKTVQLALGHSTPMITLNTYVHDWPDGQERTRSLVDNTLFAQVEAAITTL